MKARNSAPKRAQPDAAAQDVASIILAALDAHRRGALDEAEALYARALRIAPDHADALNLAGVLAFTRGRTAESIRLIGKAVRALPTHVDAQLNLAEALQKAGHLSEAIESCGHALRLQPDLVEAHIRIARLHTEIGQTAQALAHARVALALQPGSADALCEQGRAYRREKQFQAAQTAYRAAVAAAPDHFAALTGLAALFAEMDQTGEAVNLFRQALTVDPTDVDLYAALGSTLERKGDISGARDVYEAAIAKFPSAAGAWAGRAFCQRAAGEFDAACESFRQALRADPDYAAASLNLARMNQAESGITAQRHLARLFADTAQPARNRIQAGFALGEILDRQGDHDSAFRRFADANALYGKLRAAIGEHFERDELRESIDQIVSNIGLEQVRDTRGWGNQTDAPVFVVGLPRSGTTLVEQICASHPEVAGAGELRSILVIANALATQNRDLPHIRDWDAARARALADQHASELIRLGHGARRVIDKTPLNLMRVGLIGALFPNARIIWCRRDLRDVAVSHHTLYFSAGNLYSTDLLDCAFAMRQIERLGDFWLKASPLSILEVSYEELVGDLEPQSRRMIDFLGLNWAPACLDFHRTRRQVATPSNWQVRQPIYASSVGRWRRYERHIGPMLLALAK